MVSNISKYLPQTIRKEKAVKVEWQIIVSNTKNDKTHTETVPTWWRFTKEKFDATMRVVDYPLQKHEQVVMILSYYISPQDLAMLEEQGVKLSKRREDGRK